MDLSIRIAVDAYIQQEQGASGVEESAADCIGLCIAGWVGSQHGSSYAGEQAQALRAGAAPSAKGSYNLDLNIRTAFQYSAIAAADMNWMGMAALVEQVGLAVSGGYGVDHDVGNGDLPVSAFVVAECTEELGTADTVEPPEIETTSDVSECVGTVPAACSGEGMLTGPEEWYCNHRYQRHGHAEVD